MVGYLKAVQGCGTAMEGRDQTQSQLVKVEGDKHSLKELPYSYGIRKPSVSLFPGVIQEPTSGLSISSVSGVCRKKADTMR